MQHSEGTFSGAGSLNLYHQAWRPDGTPRGTLAIVHGVAEHSGRYAHVVGALLPRGYAVYAFDQRGHGRSPGQRVHITRWDEYRDDLRAFLRMVGEREPGRPLFLYGHSMGAVVVLDYLLSHQEGLRGVIVSGVPLRPVGVAKPHLAVLARVMSPLLPRFTVRTQLDVSMISRDPQVVRAYTDDPMVTRAATVRWGTEILAAIERVRAGLPRIRLPILFVHGGADRLNSPEGAREAYEHVTSTDKTLRIYPDTYHEPHNDLDRATVLADLAAWLDARS